MMTHLLRILAAMVLLPAAFAQQDPAPSPPAAETDVSVRSKALELAGAFSNDGYKIRDGYWPGEIEPNRSQFLEVNLFAGNEYWFSAAVTSPGRKIAVGVLNEKGTACGISNLRGRTGCRSGIRSRGERSLFY